MLQLRSGAVFSSFVAGAAFSLRSMLVRPAQAHAPTMMLAAAGQRAVVPQHHIQAVTQRKSKVGLEAGGILEQRGAAHRKALPRGGEAGGLDRGQFRESVRPAQVEARHQRGAAHRHTARRQARAQR